MNPAMHKALLPVSLLLAGLAVITASLTPGTPAVRIDEDKGMAALEGRKSIRLPASVSALAVTEFENTNSPGVSALAKELPAEISEFGTIMRKALRSEGDLREAKRLRRNRAVLQSALERLSDYDSVVSGREDLVNFIQEALFDKENPEREFIASKVEEIILADNLRPEQNRPHRRELAADKGELILAYLDGRPERLEHLLNASAGSPNIQVIRNALAVGERRRQESLRIIAELDQAVSN